MKLKQLFYTGLIASSLLTTISCGDDDSSNENEYDFSDNIEAAAETYAEVADANYTDAYEGAVNLQNKVNTFVATPNQDNFQAAKQAWLDARVPYGQTEAFRFANGPIDNDDLYSEPALEGQINAWPIDENFVDYVEGNPSSGMINDTSFVLTKENIIARNEENGNEANVSTGWHAIEFLLWGQDLYMDSAGKRPYTDYVVGANGTASNQARRAEYLKIVTDLLVEDLATVKNYWVDNANYRSTFENLEEEQIISNVFESLKEMSKGELAGERMEVAVEDGNQENEHSCFSDNTHVDILQNFEGMINVYEGEYTRVDGSKVSGVSFADIAKQANTQKAAVVENLIKETRAKILAIPQPFDNAIVNDKASISSAVTSLKDLSDAWADVQVEIEREI